MEDIVTIGAVGCSVVAAKKSSFLTLCGADEEVQKRRGFCFVLGWEKAERGADEERQREEAATESLNMLQALRGRRRRLGDA